MLKIIGIFIIFTSCIYLGFYYGETFKKRNRQLNSTLKALIFLNNEVVYSNTTLPFAMENVGYKVEEPLKKLLLAVAEDLKVGESVSVYDSFIKEYRKCKGEFYLNKDDKNLIEEFIKSIGESGIYGQEKLFNLVIENIKVNCSVSKEIANKNTKMYRGLGICIGLMISVFLL